MAYFARLSYDCHYQWRIPSGAQGKSDNLKTHEGFFGFGFEEWFFNSRRFNDEHGSNNCHFAYLQAFCRKMSPDENQDLVLYTLERNGVGPANQYIVALLKAHSWRFIDDKRYLKLKRINTDGIAQMRTELTEVFQQNVMREGVMMANALKRFNQQKDCLDWYNQPSFTHRLWNIEILQRPKLLIKSVNDSDLLLKYTNKKLNRFKLISIQNLNQKNIIF